MEKALKIMNRRVVSLRTDNHKKVSCKTENLKVAVPRKESPLMVQLKVNLKTALSKKKEIGLSLVSRRRISPAVTEMVSVVSRH